ncbi:MAG: hypothetical protein JO037_11800 [Actinobacteria bacterium]|nr:hypothetical protein [Actinomycetota bacterium]
MIIAAQNAAGLFPVISPLPVPDLNGTTSTTLIDAGNAAALFPEITPAATPSPAPGGVPAAAGPQGAGGGPAGAEQRVADASSPASGTRGLTAQGLGLIALALAVLLGMTRLSVRRRGRTADRKPSAPVR